MSLRFENKELKEFGDREESREREGRVVEKDRRGVGDRKRVRRGFLRNDILV